MYQVNINKADKAKRNIATIIISSTALLVSVLSFLFSTYPQINPINQNREQKALAGDIHSQLYLADYFCEIGDYEQSIYWYGIAGSYNTEYAAIALNNLGYLYSHGLGVSERNDLNYKFSQKAYYVYMKSCEMGCKDAIINAYSLLYNGAENLFPDIDYESELAKVKRMYEDEYGEVQQYDKSWVFVESISILGTMTTYVNKYEKLEYVGMSNSVYYNYMRYKAADAGLFLLEKYIPIE